MSALAPHQRRLLCRACCSASATAPIAFATAGWRWRWLHALDAARHPHALQRCARRTITNHTHEPIDDENYLESRQSLLSKVASDAGSAIPALLSHYSATIGQSEINAFFRVSREQKQLHTALTTLRWLSEGGHKGPPQLRPTLLTVNLNELLSLCVELRQWERALQLFDTLTTAVAPDTTTYNLALTAAFRHGSSQSPRAYDRAVSLVNTILDSSSLRLDFHSYPLLLLVLVRSRTFARLDTVMLRLRQSGFAMNVSCHVLLMEFYQHQRLWTKALEHFDAALRAADSQSLREPAFSMAIQAAKMAGNHRRAKEIYELAQARSVTLAARTGYELLLTSLSAIHEWATITKIARHTDSTNTDWVWQPSAVRLIVQAVKMTGELSLLPSVIGRSLSAESQHRCDTQTLEQALDCCLSHYADSTSQSSPESVTQPVFLTLIALYKQRGIALTAAMYLASMDFFLRHGQWQQCDTVRREMLVTISDESLSDEEFSAAIHCELNAKQLAGQWEASVQLMRKLAHRLSLRLSDDDRWDLSDELQSAEAFDSGIATLASAEEWSTLLQLFFELPLDSSIIPAADSCQLAVEAGMVVRDWQAVLAVWSRIQHYERHRPPVTVNKPARHFGLKTTKLTEREAVVADDGVLNTYDSVVYCCYRLQQYELANTTFTELRAKRLTPQSSTFTTMIRVWTDTRSWQNFNLLLHSLTEEQFEMIEMAAINDAVRELIMNCGDRELVASVVDRLAHLLTAIGAMSSAPSEVKLSSHPRDHRQNLFVPRAYERRRAEFLSFPLVVRPMTAMQGAVVTEGLGHVSHYDENDNIVACVQLAIQLLVQTRSVCSVLVVPPHMAVVEGADRLCESALASFEPPVRYGSLHADAVLVNSVIAVSDTRARSLKQASAVGEAVFETDGERKRKKKAIRELESENPGSDAPSMLVWGVLVRAEEIDRVAQLVKRDASTFGSEADARA